MSSRQRGNPLNIWPENTGERGKAKLKDELLVREREPIRRVCILSSIWKR